MPPKSNNQKKKEAEAAGKAPKKTKQQENAGKSASQKKAEMQVKLQFNLFKSQKISLYIKLILLFVGQACCWQGEEVWWLVNYYVIKLVHVDVQSNLWNPFFMA